MDLEKTAPKQRGPPFRPGQSGNPAGRPRGACNRSTIAAESLLEGEAEALTRKAVELALADDTTALRLCIERLVPPRKDRLVEFVLPPITSADDAAKAMSAVLAAVAEGRITPAEAAAVAGLVDSCRRAIGPEPPLVAGSAHINVSFRQPGDLPS
jgi:hypothetical protein